MLALTLVLLGDTGASAARVVPLPGVRATSGEVAGGGGAVRVRSLVVDRVHGVREHPARLTVSCNRCPRLPTPVVKDYPTPTSKLFAGLNWLLAEGHGIKVTVTRPGHLGRFVRLSARRRGARLRLAYRDSGCLDGRRKLVRCPGGSAKVPRDQPVPSSPEPPSEPDWSMMPAPDAPLDPQPLEPPLPAARHSVCSDGIDNDGDGRTDYPADPGCASATDGAEKEAVCSDGRDNDGDGRTDYPADPGCASADGGAERPPACSDGIDNDGDGKTDYPADPGCASATDPAERV